MKCQHSIDDSHISQTPRLINPSHGEMFPSSTVWLDFSSVAMTYYALSDSAHRRAALVHHPRRDNTPPRRPRQRRRRLQIPTSSNTEVEVLTEVEV